MFADVILDMETRQLDRIFQYKIPERFEEEITIGTAVRVLFGNSKKERTAYVVGISSAANWDESKIKEIRGISGEQVSSMKRLIEVASFMKDAYGSTGLEALKAVMPVRNKMRDLTTCYLDFKISGKELEDYIGFLKQRKYHAKLRFVEGMKAESLPVSYEVIRKKYQGTKSVRDGLIREGIIKKEEEETYRSSFAAEKEPEEEPDLSLTPEQTLVLKTIRQERQKGRHKTYLLYGVTGSGKTEVYIQLLKDVVREGKQGIVLIPEIALTYQTVRRFQRVFGNRVSVLHSRLSEGERYDQYKRAQKGEIDVMVGPRSALFTPFPNPGMILMDEEHETSYISETNPRYHTDEVAEFMANQLGIDLILGSATPSLRNYVRAEAGEIACLHLRERVGAAKLPDVEVVDMRRELREGNISIFSRSLQLAIKGCLERKEQCMLFVNRRGYAGIVSCRNCGNVIQCPHCSVSLKAHRNLWGKVSRLKCHYCGYEENVSRTCPSCGSDYIGLFGLGTQKVEEELSKMFPEARILRMDADTTKGKGGHERILSVFRKGEGDILIGTQMIVKGHDFPMVTLVSALAADMSLFDEDYKSAERTFQLLMQAAGRAGRGERAGTMILQTYQPDHYVMESVRQQKAEFFYKVEKDYRKVMEYPPYAFFLTVGLRGDDPETVYERARELSDEFQKLLQQKGECIGPVSKNLKKRNDRFLLEFYVRLKSEEQMKEIIALGNQWNRDRTDVGIWFAADRGMER